MHAQNYIAKVKKCFGFWNSWICALNAVKAKKIVIIRKKPIRPKKITSASILAGEEKFLICAERTFFFFDLYFCLCFYSCNDKM